MRESEIKKGIMQGGVEECIKEKEPDILLNSILLESEFTMRASGDGKDESIMTEKYLTFEREMRERFGSMSYYPEIPRSAAYVEQQLKLLARQLWYINAMVGQSMLPAVEVSNG